MNPLLEWTISNTAIATGLALVAMLVARFGRTPTLSHVLWLLVLMKLITPPIWKVPVAWTPPGESMTISDVEPVAEFALTGENFSTLDTAELQSATEAFETLPVAQETISASIERSPVPFPIGKLLLSLWAIGSITWFLLAGWRVWKFGKLLKHATPVSTEIQTTIDNIAERMGLRKVPRVVTVEGILPPLLWPFFRRTTIALPAGLLKTLSQNELETLVAHELAHYRRRDHWLRWFESAVLGIYWWHPLVWWCRRELRRAEEDCCDAWVLWAFPESARNYVESLMKTFDFLAEKSKPVPAMACGVGRTGKIKNIKERFEMILNTKPAHRMSWKQVVFTGLLAVAVLPLSGYILRAQIIPVEEREQSANAGVVSSDESSSIEERLAKLEEMIANLVQNSAYGGPEQSEAQHTSNAAPDKRVTQVIPIKNMDASGLIQHLSLHLEDSKNVTMTADKKTTHLSLPVCQRTFKEP